MSSDEVAARADAHGRADADADNFFGPDGDAVSPSMSPMAAVFDALNGLRNAPALLAFLGCAVVGVVVGGLLVASTGFLGRLAGLLAGLAYALALATGVNAAGVLQMDRARGIGQRSVVDALAYGLLCVPRLLVLGLSLFAVAIAVFIAIALVLLICKLPFLGPLLFAFAFPLSVIVAGLTVWGVGLCFVLSLPAVWQGAGIARALAQTYAVVRHRLVEAVLLLVALGLLCFAVAAVVSGLLFAGLVPTLGMSASLVGFGGDMANMATTLAAGAAPSSAHAIAGAIGAMLLWAVTVSLVGQVYLRGLGSVYLRLTDGLDLSATEEMLRARFDEVRRPPPTAGAKAEEGGPWSPSAPATATFTGAAGSPGSAEAGGTSRPGGTSLATATSSAPSAAAAVATGAAAAAWARADDSAPAPFRGDPFATAPLTRDITPSFQPLRAPGERTDIDLPLDDIASSSPSPASAPSPSPSPSPPLSPERGGPPLAATALSPDPSLGPAPGLTTDRPAYRAAPAAAAAAERAAPVEPVPGARPSACPQCLAPVEADDVFCGVCGFRLR